MGYDSGLDLIELARDRTRWDCELDRLKGEHSSLVRYVPVTQLQAWRAARKRANTNDALQYVEEGSHPFPHLGDAIHIYTDGSCVARSGSQLHVGAGVGLVVCGATPSDLCRAWPLLEDCDMRNDRAELYAAISAYKVALALHRSLVLHTDSSYVWNFLHNVRRAHRLTSFVNLENPDLLRTLDGLDRTLRHVHGLHAWVIKVRAHNANLYNEHADALAVRGSAISFTARTGSAFMPSTVPARPRSAIRAALPYFCPLCPERRYKRPQDLKGHFTRTHPDCRDQLLQRVGLHSGEGVTLGVDDDV